jgi:Predicted DNA-binding protein containing a Zn-ribbon domain
VSTRMMTDREARYLMHVTNGDPLIASYLNNQVNHGQNFLQQAANLLVCEKCESAALAHQQGYVCPRCGYRSATRSQYKVRDHIKRGAFR